jgi:hypothetical protein
LTNPHKIPAKRFALKADRKQFAIHCGSGHGPTFGCYPPDIAVYTNCHIEGGATHTSGFGRTYLNDTGVTDGIVLTGSQKFQVKEIEVFEIIAESADLMSPLTQTLQSDVRTLKIGFHSRKIDSLIMSDFPEIFAEFHGKQFSLLWRGSRDGFEPKTFHDRCDGHGHTLTIIHDTRGNIFGGYTPLEWESCQWNGKKDETNNCLKCDESLTSFLFTLTNPHNIPAKRFALKADRKQFAIFCEPTYGPTFGSYSADIVIHMNCHIEGSDASTGGFGTTYLNETRFTSGAVLTGSPKFTVKEIEVFEIVI